MFWGAAPAPVPGGGRAAEAEQPEGDGVAEIVDDDDDGADDSDEEAAPEGATKAGELKREAVPQQHLLTHRPKNPYCPTCQWAKALRAQQRGDN